MVADGRMPKPWQIDGRKVWDIRKIDVAPDNLSREDGESSWAYERDGERGGGNLEQDAFGDPLDIEQRSCPMPIPPSWLSTTTPPFEPPLIARAASPPQLQLKM
jgi:hypothetical protein